MMTPLQIFEYKNKWMSTGNNNPVSFHSDYRSFVNDWCKSNLHKSQYMHSKFTDVYEDTVYFEFEKDAKLFSNYLKKITQKG